MLQLFLYSSTNNGPVTLGSSNSRNDSDQSIEELYLDKTLTEILVSTGNFVASLNHSIYPTPSGQRASPDFAAPDIRVSSKYQYGEEKNMSSYLALCSRTGIGRGSNCNAKFA